MYSARKYGNIKGIFIYMNDSTDPHSQSSSQLSSEYKPKNFAPSPDFRWLCAELFAKLDTISENRPKYGKSATVKYLEVIIYFIKLWRTTVGDNFYPVLRLILPYRDIRTYNIKEFTLIKALCKSLNLPRDSLTERRLINWKQYAGRGVNLSHFCVQEISKRRREPENLGSMSIDKLNETLSDLSKEASTTKWGFTGLSESPSFQYCMQHMSFLELRYFFDIILKVRVIGGLEHKFLSCWHPDAQDYLGVVSDLKVLTEKLWDPSVRLGRTDLSINIGYAFAPHLAKRIHISYEKICVKLKSDFLIEEKMDGERIQLHYMEGGSKLRFLSRRGTDYTHLYGESVQQGVVSQFLRLKDDVRDCVLDGEMVSFDKDRKVVLPFGIVKSSAVQELVNASASIENEGYRPLYMIFDLVYLNGVSLTRLPLHVRKEYLKAILTPVPYAVEILPGLRSEDPSAITTSLQRAIEMGSEGLILKQYSSTYDIGARNDHWVKIKPEYFEDLGETMDLIIIGRDPGKKDSLMCGLVETRSEEEQLIIEKSSGKNSSSTLTVLSFCNVANGVSDEEFKEIDRKTRGLWKAFKVQSPPESLLEFGTKQPVEWIDPRLSLVLEVKARSVDNNDQIGKKYKVGSTLHGAYCRRIRDDKDWTSCATVEQYQQAKRAHNYYAYKKRGHEVSARKRKSPKIPKLSYLEDSGALNTVQETKIFEGINFYILSDFVDLCGRRYDKQLIALEVKKHGGNLMHNITVKPEELSSLWIVSGKTTIECRSLFERGYDIIDPSWVFDSIASGARVRMEPKHCFYASCRLLDNSKRRVDKFGDSFCRPSSRVELQRLIEASYKTVAESRIGVLSELDAAPLFMLQRYQVYVVANSPILTEVQEMKTTIKLFGGSIVENISQCNLIIAHSVPKNEDCFSIKQLRKEVAKKFLGEVSIARFVPHIVNTRWLKACVDEQCLVPEEDYPFV
ncbi:LANO_0A06766g1_1 [Lachancea nothofagi CBS 11611]|uniref:DNA ligase n=1 Tax=Lachancea nothofagi CBS 11611 TaxID=1266666 RepID=A0A1G4IS06_9SACH|nr:LANO_0A06766g1_1 [Lachancea nothofagi CBS 11611]